MSRTSDAILLTEGDASVLYTITIKRDGTAVNLTGYGSVARDGHAPDAPEGPNPGAGGACTGPSGGALDATGVVEYTFTAANTTVTGGKTVKGTWRLKLVNATGGIEWTSAQTFEITKNEMVA